MGIEGPVHHAEMLPVTDTQKNIDGMNHAFQHTPQGLWVWAGTMRDVIGGCPSRDRHVTGR